MLCELIPGELSEDPNPHQPGQEAGDMAGRAQGYRDGRNGAFPGRSRYPGYPEDDGGYPSYPQGRR